VVEAITSLPKGKTPSHDNLSTKFFQENVEEIAHMLFLAFQGMLSLGLTSNFINKGMITLILKFGDHSKLGIGNPSLSLEVFTKYLLKS
jgi:hypothetical protein